MGITLLQKLGISLLNENNKTIIVKNKNQIDNLALLYEFTNHADTIQKFNDDLLSNYKKNVNPNEPIYNIEMNIDLKG